MRILEPMRLDFAALADGVRRNNVGVAGITFEAEVRFRSDRVVIDATDQSFPFSGSAPSDGWNRLVVTHWDEPARTVLRAVDGALGASARSTPDP